MLQQIHQTKNEFKEDLAKIDSREELEKIRIRYLGRKGKLTQILRQITNLSLEERKKIGSLANESKKELERRIREKEQFLFQNIKEEFDITLPGIKLEEGHLHLISKAIEEIEEIFKQIGFLRQRYPEVETDYYAFESLNMPKGHPARDEWETFFISDNIVLTPHTSSAQVRQMQKQSPPIRMINISKCYRRQADVSHLPMFHQFEGLYIDKNVGLYHLKGVFDYFVKEFFGPARQIRLRPFHFRFTEPSLEVDINCSVCLGKGRLPEGGTCRLCKDGWLELGGAGMVHPAVLKNGGIDPKKYSGFAFGWGVERTYMMKSGLKIDDIRILYQNDLRFLEQF